MKITACISVLFCFVLTNAFGQKIDAYNKNNDAYTGSFARLHYWDYKLSNAQDTATIKSLIKSELNFSEDDGLVVTHIAQSLTATHITFKQLYKGHEVFGGGAKVAISKNNVLFRCIETIFSTSGSLAALPAQFNVGEKLVEFNTINLLENKAVYLYDGNKLMAGWYAKFLTGQNGYYDAAWFADGTRYFLHDLLSYAQDSAVSMKVFNPDPITPISKTYGGAYIDNNDENETVLNPLRQEVTIDVTYENDTFYLKNNYVEIVEDQNPVNPIVKSTVPSFDFSRSDFEFEQVNAYYHITTFQNYLQTLGYTLVNYPIRVDANGWFGQDNSSFSSGSLPFPLLSFGEGGVDDAEDADVVVHEYGHAISHSASPNSNNGNERRSLDEAVGDYFAVTYKRTEYSFGSDLVFNWDGHNAFWAGRTVNNPDYYNYKTASGFSNIYKYTTLWNDAMFDIWDQLGKTYTDKLQIEALYGYYINMSFSQAALMVVDADTAMSGGANGVVIWKAFDERGILDWTSVSEHNPNLKPYIVKNSFCNLFNPVRVDVNSQGFTAELYDLNGKLISTQQLNAGDNQIQLNNAPSGMYVLKISREEDFFQDKIIVTN